MKDPNDPVMSLGFVWIARLSCMGLEVQAWRQRESAISEPLHPRVSGWQNLKHQSDQFCLDIKVATGSPGVTNSSVLEVIILFLCLPLWMEGRGEGLMHRRAFTPIVPGEHFQVSSY